MTQPHENLRMVALRDYRTSSRYEFVIYAGDPDDPEIVAREGGYKTSIAAKRAGLKVAAKLQAA